MIGAWAAATLPEGAVPRGPLGWLARFDTSLPFFLGITAALRLLQRPGEDHAAGWLHAYCANRNGRAEYVGALLVAVGAPSLIALLAGAGAFGIAHLILGAGADPLLALPSRLVTGVLFIGGAAVYGLVIGLLCRDAGAAVGTAVFLVVLPIAIAVPWMLAHDQYLPIVARRLLVIHLPPVPEELAAGAVAQGLAYIGVLGYLGRRIAPSAVARL